MFGSIEKKNVGYLMRVTVGYNHKGNPDRISKIVHVETEKEAQLELIKWIAELEKDGYDKPKNYKFGRFVYDEWLKYAEKKLAHKTYTMYLKAIELRFMNIFKNKEISRIKKIEIVRVIDNLKRLDGKKGPLAKSTQINILAAIQSVFDYAAYLEIITSNPTEGIRIGPDERQPDDIKTYRPYSTKEIAEIFSLLDTESLKLQAIISTAIVTGAREGEIAALETKHINKKESTLTFAQTVVDKKGEGATIQHFTKTRVVKVVHVPESLINLLETVATESRKDYGFDSNLIEINPKSEFIFKGTDIDKPMRADSLLQTWTRFVNRHNVRYVRFHDLRHTSATYLLSQTGNLKAVQERLGHKDYLTTANFYAHVLEETDKESSAVFEQFLPKKNSSATSSATWR